jgi:hypothetical protein
MKLDKVSHYWMVQMNEVHEEVFDVGLLSFAVLQSYTKANIQRNLLMVTHDQQMLRIKWKSMSSNS